MDWSRPWSAKWSDNKKTLRKGHRGMSTDQLDFPSFIGGSPWALLTFFLPSIIILNVFPFSAHQGTGARRVESDEEDSPS